MGLAEKSTRAMEPLRQRALDIATGDVSDVEIHKGVLGFPSGMKMLVFGNPLGLELVYTLDQAIGTFAAEATLSLSLPNASDSLRLPPEVRLYPPEERNLLADMALWQFQYEFGDPLDPRGAPTVRPPIKVQTKKHPEVAELFTSLLP